MHSKKSAFKFVLKFGGCLRRSNDIKVLVLNYTLPMLMLLNKCQIRVIGLLNYNFNVIKLGLVIKWKICQALGEDKFINEVIPLGEGKLDMHASPIMLL